jgi:hypothetical protein
MAAFFDVSMLYSIHFAMHRHTAIVAVGGATFSRQKKPAYLKP